jgi:hypothetical protein
VKRYLNICCLEVGLVWRPFEAVRQIHEVRHEFVRLCRESVCVLLPSVVLSSHLVLPQ